MTQRTALLPLVLGAWTACSPAIVSRSEAAPVAAAAPVQSASALDSAEIDFVMTASPQVLDAQALVTRLGAGIQAGGMDTSRSFDTRLASRVIDCREQVRAETLRWAEKHGMQIVRDRPISRTHLQLLMRQTDRPGLLEILYEVSIEQGLARCRTAFYEPSGQRIEPEGIGIPDLSSALARALTCVQ